jgi:hypothetical protein
MAKLLIEMGYFEGSTLAVMEPGKAQPFTRIRSDGPVCCMFSWAADGLSVFAANPHYMVGRPGLWRYDAETGEEYALVATDPALRGLAGRLSDLVTSTAQFTRPVSQY